MGIVYERLMGVGMGSEIPTVRMKSRFYRFVAGGAVFAFPTNLSTWMPVPIYTHLNP
jgi:hypothetical protein